MTHYLYRFTDAEGRLLYVGESVDALNRAAQHKQNAPWFWRVAAFHITAFETREEAQRAEAVAIRSEQPMFNRRFTGDYEERDRLIAQERALKQRPSNAIPLPTYDDATTSALGASGFERDRVLAQELMRQRALAWVEQLRRDTAQVLWLAEKAWVNDEPLSEILDSQDVWRDDVERKLRRFWRRTA